MKLAPFFFVTLCSAASVLKRASTTEKATIGFAILDGGTSGGGTATPITVSTLQDLRTAVQGDGAKVVLIEGVISGSEMVDIGGNTTVIGKSGARLEGVGLRINATENISKVLAETGDAIRTISSSRVWIDHMDLSSDTDNDRDYYGGLIYVAKGTAGISITYCYLHDHWKASLAGLSDTQTEEGKVMWAYNKWERLNLRVPTVRWGIYHVFCNYYIDNSGSITVGTGSDIFVESNVFESMYNPVTLSGGTLRARDNIGYTPPGGTVYPEYGYVYFPGASSGVKELVNGNAGATPNPGIEISFMPHDCKLSSGMKQGNSE
ncbi:unnamed protein product [Rhizoctonia solani]|uniref:pectate lyase n=1 Tax=Rhizoctonia solani TaxID=456999 RepID=A0A8H3CW55_9AGAM|nr:unnamed protein product [Rhizoctonia solani]